MEPGVAIVAASLATIRPLLRALRIRGFDSTGHSGRSGGMKYAASRSAYNGTLNRYDPKHPAAVELGRMGGESSGRRPYSTFSRPQRPPVYQGPKSVHDMGDASDADGGDRTLRVSWNEDVQSSLSSLDYGRDAQSQHSGRVGLGSEVRW